MAEFCNCAAGFGNTGRKKDLIKQSRGLFLVRILADDGTRNGIDIGDDVDAAYVTDKVNEADTSKRWFPLQDVKNVEDVRAESVFETFNDGTRAKTRQGNRTFTGSVINQGPVFKGKLDTFACEKYGVYFIDDCHELVGSLSNDGQTLYPVAISDGSFDVTLIKANDTATGRVMVSFDVSVLESDASLRVLGGLDFTQFEGLYDVLPTVDDISATSLELTAVLEYGAFQAPIPVKGLVVGDFLLYNNTDTASVTISSVTETSDGVYLFDFPSQTAADSLTLSLDKDGYEMAAVTFTI